MTNLSVKPQPGVDTVRNLPAETRRRNRRPTARSGKLSEAFGSDRFDGAASSGERILGWIGIYGAAAMFLALLAFSAFVGQR